jgi:hypothetical protein
LVKETVVDTQKNREQLKGLAESLQEYGLWPQIGEIKIPDGIDPNECFVFRQGRVKISCFQPLATGNSHLARPAPLVYVLLIANQEAIIGHGVLRYNFLSTISTGIVSFRFAIHGGNFIPKGTAIVCYQGKGYGKESLNLIMAMSVKGGLFSGTVDKFKFFPSPQDGLYPFSEEIPKMRKFLNKMGFDRHLEFNTAADMPAPFAVPVVCLGLLAALWLAAGVSALAAGYGSGLLLATCAAKPAVLACAAGAGAALALALSLAEGLSRVSIPEAGLDTIGKRIRWAREHSGLRISRLARLSGIKTNTLCNMENPGTNNVPHKGNLVAVANVLGRSPVWIISGKETAEDAAKGRPFYAALKMVRQCRLLTQGQLALRLMLQGVSFHLRKEELRQLAVDKEFLTGLQRKLEAGSPEPSPVEESFLCGIRPRIAQWEREPPAGRKEGVLPMPPEMDALSQALGYNFTPHANPEEWRKRVGLVVVNVGGAGAMNKAEALEQARAEKERIRQALVRHPGGRLTLYGLARSSGVSAVTLARRGWRDFVAQENERRQAVNRPLIQINGPKPAREISEQGLVIPLADKLLKGNETLCSRQELIKIGCRALKGAIAQYGADKRHFNLAYLYILGHMKTFIERLAEEHKDKKEDEVAIAEPDAGGQLAMPNAKLLTPEEREALEGMGVFFPGATAIGEDKKDAAGPQEEGEAELPDSPPDDGQEEPGQEDEVLGVDAVPGQEAAGETKGEKRQAPGRKKLIAAVREFLRDRFCLVSVSEDVAKCPIQHRQINVSPKRFAELAGIDQALAQQLPKIVAEIGSVRQAGEPIRFYAWPKEFVRGAK